MNNLYYYVVFFIATINVLLGAVQVGLLRRRKPWPRFIALGICLWTFLMVVLLILQALSPVGWRPFLRHWFYFPIAVEMSWNVLFVQVSVLVAIVTMLLLRWLHPLKPSSPSLSPADLSRRKFIYLLAFGAAPATALGMGVHGSITRHDLRVRRFDLPITNLPPSLEGFTIAHVSDFHSGIFCGPRRLEIITAATNDLNADLIAITGDIINTDMAEFPDALVAMRRMRSRYDIFLCEGNHDVIPGPGLVARACRENGLPMLMGQRTIVPVEGGRLILAGVPWLGRRFVVNPDLISGFYPEREAGDVRILLAHHPHLFDSADSADLVLAGHTHGGQIMAGPVGFGPLFFRYWSGLYRRNSSTLIVSNGCGDWFPCRIGAPAEIGLLRLIKA